MQIEKIDQYIAEKPAFAQDILNKLRAIIHQADPSMEEAIKWSQPCFSKHGLVCAMAAFKAHVNLAFFEGKHIEDLDNIFGESDGQNLASLKLKSVDDLPNDVALISFIQRAIAYNSSTEKPKKKVTRKDKSTLVVPDDLAEVLAENPVA